MLSCAFQIGVVFSVVFFVCLIFVTLLPFLFVYPLLLCCNFYFPLLFGFYFLHTLLFLVQLIFYNAQFIFCWFCFVLCFHFLSLILRFYFLMTCMLYIFAHFLAINFLLNWAFLFCWQVKSHGLVSAWLSPDWRGSYLSTVVCDSRSNLYTTVKTYAPGVIPFQDTEDIDLSLHLLRKLPQLNRQIVQLKDQITLNFKVDHFDRKVYNQLISHDIVRYRIKYGMQISDIHAIAFAPRRTKWNHCVRSYSNSLKLQAGSGTNPQIHLLLRSARTNVCCVI